MKRHEWGLRERYEAGWKQHGAKAVGGRKQLLAQPRSRDDVGAGPRARHASVDAHRALHLAGAAQKVQERIVGDQHVAAGREERRMQRAA